MGQSSLSQLARTLLSFETESKYPPPKNKHTQKFHTHTTHTNRCEKNGEEIGSLLYYYSNPYQQRHYPPSIFSNPNTNIQTPLYFPLFLSLRFERFCTSIRFDGPLSFALNCNSCFPLLFIYPASLVLLFRPRLYLSGVLKALKEVYTLIRFVT